MQVFWVLVWAAAAMPQVKLGSCWKVAHREPLSDVASAATKIDVAAAAREVRIEREAAKDGEHFVNNGNRDRYGNQRQNVGGRPKKVNPQVLSSNRRVAGNPKRNEFSAVEKIQMIEKIKNIEIHIRSVQSSMTEEILKRAVQQAIWPHPRSSRSSWIKR
jgi:hypothetical protein